MPQKGPGANRYRGVRVSPLIWDFTKRHHRDIPRELLQEWANLIVELAHILDENFQLPPLPDRIEFREEVEYSDGPYPSDENYIAYPYFEFNLRGEEGRGLSFTFTQSSRVEVQTVRARCEVCSSISQQLSIPLADIIFSDELSSASPAQLEAIDAAIARHHRRCSRL